MRPPLRLRLRLAPGLLVVAALGCGGADERPASWGYIHEAIILPSCATAGCHTDAHARGGVTLEGPAASAALLVGRGYVTPGDPTSSLMDLLEGAGRGRMPPDAPLPRADVELIRRWIVEGAEGP